ncbi:MAG: radical SAM protein [Desulfobacter sp.]|nr:MAG: radical SAM protein [Desulfobacter sp.]
MGQLDELAELVELAELDELVQLVELKGENIILPFIPQVQVTLNCNLDCRYCFQDHRPGVMDPDTLGALLDKVAGYARASGRHRHPVPVYWHGGEPLAAGISFFQTIMALEARYPDIQFNNRVQTNGTLMTEEWASFFTTHGFDVGFSLDGPGPLHDLNRRFKNSCRGSFDAAVQGIDNYRKYAGDIQVPVIAVVTSKSMGQADLIYEFFARLGARVQLDIFDIRCRDLMPPSGPLEPGDVYAPPPDTLGRFLVDLFDRWFHDGSQRTDFKEFHDEVKIALQPELDFGNPFHKRRCSMGRTIIDPDGLVFACDQYVNDEKTALGHICRDNISEMLGKKHRQWEEIKARIRGSSGQMACSRCQAAHTCSGGCMTCARYTAKLLAARAKGLPDRCWVNQPLPAPLARIRGEFYYCDALRQLRSHIKKAVAEELVNEEQ